eukprot:2094583-Rhodomonas_salina.1
MSGADLGTWRDQDDEAFRRDHRDLFDDVDPLKYVAQDEDRQVLIPIPPFAPSQHSVSLNFENHAIANPSAELEGRAISEAI